MTKQELETKKTELEKRLKMKEDTHAKKFGSTVNESAYQDSCAEIRNIYKELSDICDQLGEFIPVRM
jgi:hypothetical protein